MKTDDVQIDRIWELIFENCEIINTIARTKR